MGFEQINASWSIYKKKIAKKLANFNEKRVVNKDLLVINSIVNF